MILYISYMIKGRLFYSKTTEDLIMNQAVYNNWFLIKVDKLTKNQLRELEIRGWCFKL